MVLAIGDLAPNFTSPTFDKQSDFTLSNFKGKNIILYFYPKDDTPGCTTEAADFTYYYDSFTKANSIIVGVSKDSPESHKKFRDKYQIPFYLISDIEQSICKTYGVWIEKSMYGKKYMGIQRTSYLINSDGIIKYVWNKVKVKNHAKKVLEQVNNLYS